jgi:hypothetical protein
MRPGIVSPDELKLLDGVLQKASAELRYPAGSEQYEELATRLVSLFQTLKDPDELLAAAVRGARFERF